MQENFWKNWRQVASVQGMWGKRFDKRAEHLWWTAMAQLDEKLDAN